ncbi:MAG: hypothetical protein FWF15_00020 [Oscillospiraceae bacterium]|nr:hypothetical protein [Oscillospiraceae bacterium]
MNEINEIKKACESMKSAVNTAFDRLILLLGSKDATGLPMEYVYLFTANTHIFIGTKPAAVLFGEERAEADNWRKIFAAIMSKCNSDAQCHENLMYLLDKISGRDRILLSRSPDSMRRPLRIDEDMYAEVSYGTATLLYILRDRILAPANFDYSGISIVLKI